MILLFLLLFENLAVLETLVESDRLFQGLGRLCVFVLELADEGWAEVLASQSCVNPIKLVCLGVRFRLRQELVASLLVCECHFADFYLAVVLDVCDFIHVSLRLSHTVLETKARPICPDFIGSFPAVDDLLLVLGVDPVQLSLDELFARHDVREVGTQEVFRPLHSSSFFLRVVEILGELSLLPGSLQR